jgi:hypothetical protein
MNELQQDPSTRVLIRAFARLDKVALGVSVGAVAGVAVFFATLLLVIKGGSPLGPNLALLSQYFIGYKVSLLGSVVGLLYGFASGFVLGWLVAFLRNLMVSFFIYTIKLKAQLASLDDVIGHP